MGQIYLVINIINNKKYIGETSKSLEIRRYEHEHKSNKCKDLFHKALRKYGIDMFKWILLEDNVDNIELKRNEAKYIIELNTLVPIGYNLKYSLDDKTFLSDYTKKQISESLKGNTNKKGKKCSDETKKNISNAKLGKKHSIEHNEKIKQSMIKTLNKKNNL